MVGRGHEGLRGLGADQKKDTAMAHTSLARWLKGMPLTAGVCSEALAHRGCYSEGEEEKGRGGWKRSYSAWVMSR